MLQICNEENATYVFLSPKMTAQGMAGQVVAAKLIQSLFLNLMQVFSSIILMLDIIAKMAEMPTYAVFGVRQHRKVNHTIIMLDYNLAYI